MDDTFSKRPTEMRKIKEKESIENWNGLDEDTRKGKSASFVFFLIQCFSRILMGREKI